MIMLVNQCGTILIHVASASFGAGITNSLADAWYTGPQSQHTIDAITYVDVKFAAHLRERAWRGDSEGRAVLNRGTHRSPRPSMKYLKHSHASSNVFPISTVRQTNGTLFSCNHANCQNLRKVNRSVCSSRFTKQLQRWCAQRQPLFE